MKFLIGILCLLIIPLACANDSINDSKESYSYAMADTSLDDEALEVDGFLNLVDLDQKLIKESVLRFETQDMSATYKSIAVTISKYKGFVQNDSENKGYQQVSRQLIIRLPSENFQKAIDDIGKGVSYFDTKRISSKDITEEFIDLEARLKAKKALENRYIELLDKAKNVKEILAIELELSTIREEIEAKQGRLKYLSNKVALSTLNIEFYKTTAETGITQSYGSKMWKAIKSGLNGISVFFLGILHIWPFVLILVVAFFIIKKRFFKKK